MRICAAGMASPRPLSTAGNQSSRNGSQRRRHDEGAGRKSSVTSSQFGVEQYAYDNDGRFVRASYTHDPEGSVLSEAFSSAVVWAGSATLINTVNVRGELIDRGNSANTGVHTRTRTNAGCLISTTIPYDLSNYDATTDPTGDPGACDRVNGVPLSPGTGGSAEIYNGQSYPQGSFTSVAFDAASRSRIVLVHRDSAGQRIVEYGWDVRSGPSRSGLGLPSSMWSWSTGAYRRPCASSLIRTR
jgi:hypothetical protein